MGKTRELFINLGKAEVGYKETGKNITKYSAYFDTPAAEGGAFQWFNYAKQGTEWCSIFICYLVCKTLNPKEALSFLGCPKPANNCAASCSYFVKYLRAKGYEIDKTKGGSADLIFFDNNSHVGFIEYTSEGVYHTIEGNKSNKVKRCTYKIGSADVSSVFHLPFEVYDGNSLGQTEQPEVPETPSVFRYKVKTNSGVPLRIRKKPSTSSEVLGRIPNKTIIEVDEKSGKWFHTSYNGITGYCYSAYLLKVD